MPNLAGTPAGLEAAARLRAAAEIISQCMDEGRDKTDVLRRIGIAVANLTEHDAQGICRRCSKVFSFNAERFQRQQLDPPRHCYWCRQARRAERRAWSGAAPTRDQQP
jgi:hypothetical protein